MQIKSLTDKMEIMSRATQTAIDTAKQKDPPRSSRSNEEIMPALNMVKEIVGVFRSLQQPAPAAVPAQNTQVPPPWYWGYPAPAARYPPAGAHYQHPHVHTAPQHIPTMDSARSAPLNASPPVFTLETIASLAKAFR